jgi:ring-1,2-phenylacetyl-CoA epoxidase subunit PaaE
MSKYFHLTIKEIIEETADTKTISFWQPIHQALSYKAGQFITVILEINGKKERRSYSMSSSPREANLAITVKKVKNGLISNYLFETLKVGDSIEVMEPMGHFIAEPNAEKNRNIVLFGGGSGITPLMSIIKTILPVEQNSKIFLVYGSRSEEEIIFKNQLNALEQEYKGRFKVIHVLSKPSYSWHGYKTRINQASAVIFLKQDIGVSIPDAEYYLCGPEGMMEQVTNALKLFNVPQENIHKEHFVETPHKPGIVEKEDEDTSLKPQTVTIKYEGKDYAVLVKPSETILEAALNQDIDLPYSCQAGMCTACMGRCVQGKIQMDEEDGLTEKEINQGWVLTCVSHPLTDGVVIEVE